MEPLCASSWQEWSSRFPDATVFHSAAWAAVLRASYGHRPEYLGLFQGEVPAGLLPLMEVSSWLTGRRGVALPFSDECPLLAQTREGAHLLTGAALELGRQRGWRYLELRGIPEDVPAARTFHGHTLALTPDTEALWKRVESSVARAVRKGEKAGVTVEFACSLEAVRTYYRLHCLTRQRHGVPPQPFHFFQNIHAYVIARGLGQVVLARLGREAIAGAVFFHSGTTALYKFGASNAAFQSLRGNNLILWRAIESYARREYQQLDFGRTDRDNPGLRAFKGGWGARERTISYARYDFKRGKFVEGQPAVRSLNDLKLPRHVPVWMARIVGAVLYPHLS